MAVASRLNRHVQATEPTVSKPLQLRLPNSQQCSPQVGRDLGAKCVVPLHSNRVQDGRHCRRGRAEDVGQQRGQEGSSVGRV